MTTGGSPVTVRSVETRHVALPTGIDEITLPSGQRITAPKLNVVLVRLTDSDGASGYSFLWAAEGRQVPLFEAMVRYFVGQVVGQPVDAVPPLAATLRRAANFIGYEGLSSFGVAAYEMALEDLRCRRLGVSLGQLLGRRRSSVPAYRTGCLLLSSIDDIVAEAEEICASGVAGLKMQVGAADVAIDLERIEAVRSVLPADVRLMVDAVQHWTYPTAVRALDRFADLDLVWVEDPLDYDDWAGYRRLAERSPVPLATGESLYGTRSFRELAAAGIPYLVADLERVGGVAAWMRAAEAAAAESSVLLPHIYPHVSAQLVAASPSADVWLELVPWFDDIQAHPFEVRDRQVVVPDRPGAGFDPDHDGIDDHARGPWTPMEGG